MRELHSHEVEEVSGAGFITDAGAALGTGIGAIVDAATKGNTATAAGTKLGAGIGQVVEASVSVIGGFLKNLGSLFGRK
ncbi:hypothetical protein I2492_10505 [Budviciaceae bacterium CWB-B4]|uniref:Uncharacterized protein n=1 Tax=Limnobaculum xujianqingii TaxID=2738837 RepID=A0A9D7AIR1_9GAMM|nr:hypothetical protein [Limnobaculum xujianqingii]MBK5073517.1 hypothetical protein [Limnobaculum xujianqingii]MBK5176752.1 hypothetical protein [Limnobaculum xujianqingii]